MPLAELQMGASLIRILFVDDERSLLDLSKTFLEESDKDFQVDTASSTEEALQRLSKEEYDVVVSDSLMPTMGSIEFLSELRKQGNETPFIVFTGKGREEVAVEAFKRGANSYVLRGGDPTSQYSELAKDADESRDGLAESEKRYRSLVETSNDGIMVLGKDFEVMFANQRMHDLLGFKEGELIGTDYFSLVPNSELKDIKKGRKRRRIAGERSTHERKMLKKDGAEITLLVASSPSYDDAGKYAGTLAFYTDITERKKLEDEIKSLARFPSENPNPVLRVNRSGTVLYANVAAKTLFHDWDKSADNRVSSFWQDIIAKTLRDKSSQTVDVEQNNRTYSFSITPVMDLGYLNLYGIDITERKNAERVIEHRLDLERAVSKVSSYFVNVLDIDDAINVSLAEIGKVSRASRAYIFLFREDQATLDNTHEWCAEGVSPQKDKLQNIPPENTSWWKMKLHRGRAIHIPDVSKMPLESKAVKESLEGQSIKSLLAIPLHVHGKIAGFIGLDNVRGTGCWNDEDLRLLRVSSEIIGNAFGRKRSEHMIRNSETRYRTLVELAHDGIMLIEGAEQIISFSNERMADMLRYTVEELVGKSYFDLIHPEDLEDFLQSKRIVLELGGKTIMERRLLRKDGSIQYTLASASPAYPNMKHKETVIAIFTDITEWKRLEDRERFLDSLVRHDIGNKLQAAYGYLELLTRTDLPGKPRDYVKSIKGSLQDAGELIEKVRYLRLLDEARESVDTDLDQEVRDAIEGTSTLAEKKGIALEYKGIPNAMVTASPLIKNALANLIENSIKHADCKRIQITVKELEDSYCITVKDDGKGIPAPVREKLFERGVKGLGSTGSGLGLHLVKRIIDASNGTIEFKDAKKGTQFELHLKKASSK